MKNIEDMTEGKELQATVEKMDLKEDNEIKLTNGEDEMEFSISCEAFSEFKSSLFKYESPEKKFKNDDSVPSRSSQRSLSSSVIIYIIIYNFKKIKL